jgi:NADPH:quinone reductase
VRAIICRQFAPLDALTLEDVSPAELNPGQVRVRVHAAGLNFADTLIVRGLYQVKPPLPFTPGFEAAGAITEVAPDVAGLKAGDRVVTVLETGAFAEQVVAPAARVIAIPDQMEFATAAALPIAYGTAHAALAWRAAIRPGETLLVLGAAGGVGLAAIEIGKAMGAKVIAAARGGDRLRIARDHGADHVIDYEADILKARLRDATGSGVDVVLDPVGGAIGEQALRLLNWEGRLVVVGFAAGPIPQLPANILLVRNVAALGLYWGEYWRHAPDRVQDSFRTLFGWWREGKLRPFVSQRFPLERAIEALKTLAERKAAGKVVLEIAR